MYSIVLIEYLIQSLAYFNYNASPIKILIEWISIPEVATSLRKNAVTSRLILSVIDWILMLIKMLK